MAKTLENEGKKEVRKANGQFGKGHHPQNEIKPGEVRNPKGRRDAISDIIRKAVDANNGKIKKRYVSKLINYGQQEGVTLDDFCKIFDRIVDRTEGKAKQSIEITDNNRPTFTGDNPENYLSDRLSQRQDS